MPATSADHITRWLMKFSSENKSAGNCQKSPDGYRFIIMELEYHLGKESDMVYDIVFHS